MTVKIKIRQYVIFINPQKFDTEDIQCFAVVEANLSHLMNTLGKKETVISSQYQTYYSRVSVARTLMSRYHGYFELVFSVPNKKCRMIFFLILIRYVVCTH